MLKLIVRWVLVMMVGYLPATAEAATASGVFHPQTFRLENGMDVILVENHRAPAVTHMVWYRVGAADEGPGETGIAHFLEHLMFKGTKTVASGDFSKIVARYGGQDNAFTSWDYTAYYQKIASAQLPLVMRMEADRMANLNLARQDFDTEKKVILEERRSVIENNPSRLFAEQMQAALFLNHPYRRPIIGWTHEIADLKYENVLKFYRQHYGPNNAILVVVGDVTLPQLKKLAADTYGKVKAVPIERSPMLVEPPYNARRVVEMTSDKVRVPLWKLNYVLPGYATGVREQVVALQVMAQILGGSEASRLYERLVVKDKLATNISASFDADRRGPAVFEVAVVPVDDTPATLQKVDDAVMQELGRLRREPVTAAELQRAQSGLQAAAVYANDSLMQPAMVLGQMAVIGLPLELVEGWPQAVAAVTPKAIQDAMPLLDDNSAVTGILLPKK